MECSSFFVEISSSSLMPLETKLSTIHLSKRAQKGITIEDICITIVPEDKSEE